jgi:hypothetical protein
MDSMDTDRIELEMSLEEEKKKCLKNLQNYYRKYGSEKIQKLQDYLLSKVEGLADEDEKRDIKKQLELLELYS